MFHVNESLDGRGTLTVKDGKMTIHVSLASKGILNLFPGIRRNISFFSILSHHFICILKTCLFLLLPLPLLHREEKGLSFSLSDFLLLPFLQKEEVLLKSGDHKIDLPARVLTLCCPHHFPDIPGFCMRLQESAPFAHTLSLPLKQEVFLRKSQKNNRFPSPFP